MDRKQGFFSALKEEVVRGLSPARSRGKSPAPRSGSPMSSLLRRRSSSKTQQAHYYVAQPEPLIGRSGSLRPTEALSPLKEGPDGTDGQDGRMEGRWAHWMKKSQLSRSPSVTCSSSSSSNYSSNGNNNNSNSNSSKRSDLRLLLGVLGAPLAPVHVNTADPLPHLSIKDTPIVSTFISFCY